MKKIIRDLQKTREIPDNKNGVSAIFERRFLHSEDPNDEVQLIQKSK